MDSATELKRKKYLTERWKHEVIIARQWGVLDLPESYWPVICFMQRIAFANNWETKKLNTALK